MLLRMPFYERGVVRLCQFAKCASFASPRASPWKESMEDDDHDDDDDEMDGEDHDGKPTPAGEKPVKKVSTLWLPLIRSSRSCLQHLVSSTVNPLPTADLHLAQGRPHLWIRRQPSVKGRMTCIPHR